MSDNRDLSGKIMMEAIAAAEVSSKLPNIQVCKFAKENLEEQENVLKSKQNDQLELRKDIEEEEADIMYSKHNLATKRRFSSPNSEREKLFCDDKVGDELKDNDQRDFESSVKVTSENDAGIQSSSSSGREGMGQEEPIFKKNDSCFNLRNFDSYQTPINHMGKINNVAHPEPPMSIPQELKRRSTVIQSKNEAIEAAERAARIEAMEAKERAARIKQSLQFWVRKFSDILIDHLNKFGLCVIDDFIGEVKGTMILNEVLQLQETTPFMDGKLSKDLSNLSVRSDKISWVDSINPPCPAIRSLLNLLDAIVLMANKTPGNGALEQYKIQGRTKAMVACYPGRGSHYVRHVDNPNRDGRCITAIYYLNKNWTKEHGGKLMIYPSKPVGAVASVDPIFDRVLFFWSDRRNPHEVLPAYRPRYAITAWYFDSEEKSEYTKRQQEASKLK